MSHTDPHHSGATLAGLGEGSAAVHQGRLLQLPAFLRGLRHSKRMLLFLPLINLANRLEIGDDGVIHGGKLYLLIQ